MYHTNEMKKKPVKISNFRKSKELLPDAALEKKRLLKMFEASEKRAAEFKQSHDKEKSESDK